MRLSSLRIALLAVIFASASFALADQKIKTKSNIKNDRLAEAPSSVASEEPKADVKTESKAVTSQSSSSAASGKVIDSPKL